jgi:hypothetical protein
MVQQWWQKLNANERTAATGAIIVFVLSILGSGWLSLLGSAAVLVIYWLKYSPSASITWPAPVQTINFVIAAILGIFALLGLLAVLAFSGLGVYGLGFAGGFFAGIWILVLIGAIVNAVGAAMMFLGTWREYQAMPKTTPPPPPPPAA